MGKNSFILYSDQEELVNKLTNEQAGILFKALYEYSKTGVAPELDTLLDLAFTTFKTTLDRDKEKYEKKVARLVSNAKNGGAPKGNTNAKKQPNRDENNQIDIENNQIESVNVSDSVSVINNNVNNNNLVENSFDELVESSTVANKTKNQSLLEDFDKIWAEYPRKDGKGDAFRHYKSWLNGRMYAGKKIKLTNKQMWYAVVEYADLVEKRQTEKKYVKMGSSFFNSTIMDYVKPEEELDSS